MIQQLVLAIGQFTLTQDHSHLLLGLFPSLLSCLLLSLLGLSLNDNSILYVCVNSFHLFHFLSFSFLLDIVSCFISFLCNFNFIVFVTKNKKTHLKNNSEKHKHKHICMKLN